MDLSTLLSFGTEIARIATDFSLFIGVAVVMMIVTARGGARSILSAAAAIYTALALYSFLYRVEPLKGLLEPLAGASALGWFAALLVISFLFFRSVIEGADGVRFRLVGKLLAGFFLAASLFGLLAWLLPLSSVYQTSAAANLVFLNPWAQLAWLLLPLGTIRAFLR